MLTLIPNKAVGRWVAWPAFPPFPSKGWVGGPRPTRNKQTRNKQETNRRDPPPPPPPTTPPFHFYHTDLPNRSYSSYISLILILQIKHTDLTNHTYWSYKKKIQKLHNKQINSRENQHHNNNVIESNFASNISSKGPVKNYAQRSMAEKSMS